LNNDIQAGHCAGYEPTDGCCKFSTESISDTLKFSLAGPKTTKGIERNLFVKRFLSNIFYSPESIKIRFIFRQSDGEAVAERSPAPPSAGLGERTISSSKSEFVSSFMAPYLERNPNLLPNQSGQLTASASLRQNARARRNSPHTPLPPRPRLESRRHSGQ